MSSTAELKKVKLNITNIKSVLLDGKKAVDEKKKDREDFLTKLAEERKQKKEEKSLEKPIKPTEKKPDLKSPVKSSAGLMNRIFTFVGAIVGGIVVKALPDIIDAIKKVIEKVKPFFDKVVEFLEPVFTSIGNFFESGDSYESEKEKVNTDIEKAELEGKAIDGQVGELDKAGDDIIRENKALGENAKALGIEEKDLQKDRIERNESEEEKVMEQNKDDDKIKSNETVTTENLGPAPASEVTKIVDGKEVVVTDMDESLDIQNEARNMLKNAESGNFIDKIEDAEFTGIKVLTAPVPPVREDYPKTTEGLNAYITAKKEYEIQYKEFKKTRENFIKPSDKNNNGLNALNTTGGLTSDNVTGSKTIVLQRQIVQTNTVIPV
tara:strand:+ start:1366 stop:2505 length:1140 start_codon:yes stop_codon:yes gene_type:complete